MVRLTTKLAISNLIKNRKLYYPFALATILAVTISYLFDSLAFNPNLQQLRGASVMGMTLGLGVIVVTIAGAIIVFYANSFVMKNRSKELGIYGMLGLEKRHLFSMVFKELFIFGLVTVFAGIGIGALFDQLIFALLLKVMRIKVELVSTFQPMVVVLVLIIYGLIFSGLVLVNGWRIFKINALQLSREKASGEKKGRFLGLQTLLGLISLGAGYYLALMVKDPMSAIVVFFLAVLLVILGTYLLFNAGITVFLQILRKNQAYYYQPKNMISVSNLIFRMKKNAVGLATIAILSTMVLVTLISATGAFAGGENLKNIMAPHQFSISGNGPDFPVEKLEETMDQFIEKNQIPVKNRVTMDYVSFGAKGLAGSHVELFTKGENAVQPQSVFIVVNQAEYQEMSGQTLDLTDNQVALYSENEDLKNQKQLNMAGHTFQIVDHLQDNFADGKLSNPYAVFITSNDTNYLVVKDTNQFFNALSEYAVYRNAYAGLDTDLSEEQQLDLAKDLDQIANQETATLPDQSGQYITSLSRADYAQELNGLIGGIFFIGIFLSIIFMAGTVLIIYYKQISEGYEDRERFVILQKVGLDDKQIKQTIRKQVLTVFFLPLIFAFVHLAFAYHMMSLILKVLGVLNSGLMLTVTLTICAIFLAVYVLVFLITSRSYRKIVQL